MCIEVCEYKNSKSIYCSCYNNSANSCILLHSLSYCLSNFYSHNYFFHHLLSDLTSKSPHNCLNASLPTITESVENYSNPSSPLNPPIAMLLLVPLAGLGTDCACCILMAFIGTAGAFVVGLEVREKLSSELFREPRSPQVAPIEGAGLEGKALAVGRDGGPCVCMMGGGC